jgi:Zn finger protein HypA/HybF involved in hydrogenase expression
MGDIYTALCACGYRADDLFVGSGMAGSESDSEVGTCAHCREVVIVSSNDVRHLCPKCQQKVVLLDRRGMGDATFVCPGCSGKSLQLKHVGLWD